MASSLFGLPLWFQLLVVVVGFGMLAYAGIVFTRESGRIATIWLANAGLLAVLLEAPKQQRLTLLTAAYVGNIAVNLVTGDTMLIASVLALCNTLEVSICVWVLSYRAERIDLSKPADLFAFGASAGIIAPAVTAIAAALFLHFAAGAPFSKVAMIWFSADALSLLTVTPFLLARLSSFDKQHGIAALRKPLGLATLLLCFAATVLIFYKPASPFLT